MIHYGKNETQVRSGVVSIVFFQPCACSSGHVLGDTSQASTSKALHEWEAQINGPPVSHIPRPRPEYEAWFIHAIMRKTPWRQ